MACCSWGWLKAQMTLTYLSPGKPYACYSAYWFSRPKRSKHFRMRATISKVGLFFLLEQSLLSYDYVENGFRTAYECPSHDNSESKSIILRVQTLAGFTLAAAISELHSIFVFEIRTFSVHKHGISTLPRLVSVAATTWHDAEPPNTPTRLCVLCVGEAVVYRDDKHGAK